MLALSHQPSPPAMNLRSLLVVLDDDDRCAVRTRLAAGYAAAHDSHLVGIAPTGLPELISGLGAASRQADQAALARDDALTRADERIAHFRNHCHARGVAWVETEICEGERAAVVLNQAHAADLTVISQVDPASATRRDDERFVEQLLTNNARPTLLVPHSGHFDRFGDNVLIAWDGSRGCTRAVADALPILRHATQVRLCVWRHEGDPPAAAIRERLASVDRWLRWQGVTARIAVETSSGRIGDAILETAAISAADLLVMGTYGHARWAERIFGGTTRTALARAPLPLFMSH